MRYLIVIIATLIFFSFTEKINAQQEIVIDNVTNSASERFLFAGRTHVINLSYRNFPSPACSTYGVYPNNGFVISSPDGATWNRTIGTLSEPFKSLIWFTSGVQHFEDPISGAFLGQGDGIGPDYLVFFGASLSYSSGLVPGFNDIAATIEIETNLSDTNLHICIDKSEVGRLLSWKWVSYFGCTIIPGWAGEQCYKIVSGCCVSPRGNVDLDPQGSVDIADITFLIDHLFINFPLLPCRDQANIDGDAENSVDIADLTLLIDHLFINFPALPLCNQ